MKRLITLISALLIVFTFGGCVKKGDEGAIKDIPVADIIAAIEEKVDLNIVNLPKDETLEKNYYINPEDVAEAEIKTAMMNVKSNELAIIKVKDSSKVEDIKKSVEKRGEDLDKQWSSYLLDQYELVKNRKIKAIGNYVILIIDKEADQIEEIIESKLK
ncbi:hypothetical protein U732_1929 [Clostridium argentinense CDC 2741]|uniref:Lipoprotein n=1 Tax=Clostridium argentinense CDC 2741 TaxID=1418104 RepID=A0A0C1TZQ8_9CLOT|nr:DUF4358 domain-containing protein [Clostridium argentinense]ARC85867.1 hypothetical protein RSJ17_15880 [Clostridium argentinense]KIE46094.1 hypothetical protein U732_1929 [Clostridium argentinense CDC 2741]NFF39954.1 DUF4358 domain-containing protein [Clostridium argentinense]NFP48585.1 DUF4358 domain-containing protein [Clostridium argentinense]NFP71147.1 DUF4358 domain-containing protein [Clostridium argentinense]